MAGGEFIFCGDWTFQEDRLQNFPGFLSILSGRRLNFKENDVFDRSF